MENKEINREIVNNELCTGCGTCIAMCPNEAIKLTVNEKKGIYVPKINEEECNNCGICYQVCPGYSVDFKELNLEIFEKEPEDILIGNYLNCYIGHSTDYDIRYNSASGGLVSQLLIFALKKGMIDGAIVTRMKKDNPLEPEPFIARTKEEILEASKSKYCPVPANVALKEILETKEGERFAVVGLPCHIQGIRKAEMVNKKVKEKIVLHLGIFCSHTDSFRGTKLLLRKLCIKDKEVKKISYRGEGWPGKIQINLKNGDQRYISNQSILWNIIFNSFFSTPTRCLVCNDLTSELADISFGDPWLPRIMAKEQEGKSIIISRTKQGEKMLNTANSDGYIELSPIEPEKVIQSQRTFLHFKKVNLEERIKLLKLLGKKYPQVSIYRTKISFYNKFVALFPLVNSHLGSKFEYLLRHIPLKILRRYTSAFYLLCSLAIKNDFSSLLQDKKGLNILILNAHWNNRGDEAAIRAMIDSLKFELPINKMKIMILSENITNFPYDDVELIDLYHPPIPICTSVLLTLFTFGKRSLTRQGREFIKAVNEADIVIHAPGGPSIGDLYGGKLLGDFPYLYMLLISKIFKNKPLFFYAPSMGPFSGRFNNYGRFNIYRRFNNYIRKFILKRADAIILREEISARYLKEQLGLDSSVTMDSAFQNDIPEDYVSKYTNISEILNIIENEKVVGMTITDLKWHPVYKKYSGLREKIMHSLSDVAKYLVGKGYVILLIPQLFGEDDDTSLLESICRLNKEKIFILPPNIDSYAQQVIIFKLFCIISMRYHPNIFAAKGNVPSISIYYEHKMKGFIEKLGRTDLMINVEEISASKIIDKFIYLKENYNIIKKQLKKRTPQLKEESKKTTKIILEKLNDR